MPNSEIVVFCFEQKIIESSYDLSCLGSCERELECFGWGACELWEKDVGHEGMSDQKGAGVLQGHRYIYVM